MIALVSTVLVGYIAVGSVLGRVLGDSTYGQLAVFNEVVRIVLEAYVEPVNLDRAMAGARLGLTDALDGDSAYLDDEEFRAYQQGARGGDADVGVLLARRPPFLIVASVRPGSPGEKAGVKAGDILKTIDGRHTRPLSTVTGQRMLRGAPGSVAKLTLLRIGADPIDVSVTRERLAPLLPQGRLLPDGSTGYLKVAELPARAGEAVRSEVDSLRRSGARRLVLDLRGAGQGVPEEGVKLAEVFLKGGLVTKLVGRKSGEQAFTADPSRSAWELPLAVLVDNGTAGPAEIAAAALLDSGRASLVGEHTAGRAAVQKAIPLPEGGLVLTVAKYVSPKGTAIHGKGIDPTVTVAAEESDEEGSGAPAGDPALDKALELLKGGAKKAA
jgi:carboxyl-terminal processing protease